MSALASIWRAASRIAQRAVPNAKRSRSPIRIQQSGGHWGGYSGNGSVLGPRATIRCATRADFDHGLRHQTRATGWDVALTESLRLHSGSRLPVRIYRPLPILAELRVCGRWRFAGYGTTRADLWRRSAAMSARRSCVVPTGRPSVEQPTRLTSNQSRHRKALGISVPPLVLSEPTKSSIEWAMSAGLGGHRLMHPRICWGKADIIRSYPDISVSFMPLAH